jgi:predicted RNA-binding Zn-ribbon protein involved in translation (DUF1610 family)
LLIGVALSAAGLGWIVNSFLVAIAVMLVVGVVAFFLLSWWVRRNIVIAIAPCPACQVQLTALEGTDLDCPNCGEPLTVINQEFKHRNPPGTIDVDAVEVDSGAIEVEVIEPND